MKKIRCKKSLPACLAALLGAFGPALPGIDAEAGSAQAASAAQATVRRDAAAGAAASSPAGARNIADWLSALSPGQRATAQNILASLDSPIQALKSLIRKKKAELAAFSYDHTTTPRSLPGMGHELQELRHRLSSLHSLLAARLEREVGVPLNPPDGLDHFFREEDASIHSGVPRQAIRN